MRYGRSTACGVLGMIVTNLAYFARRRRAEKTDFTAERAESAERIL